eukprot:COSAG05_NODE_12506_length_465_cov_1.117486_1_plen_20_part_01
MLAAVAESAQALEHADVELQ